MTSRSKGEAGQIFCDDSTKVCSKDSDDKRRSKIAWRQLWTTPLRKDKKISGVYSRPRQPRLQSLKWSFN